MCNQVMTVTRTGIRYYLARELVSSTVLRCKTTQSCPCHTVHHDIDVRCSEQRPLPETPLQ